MNDIKRISILTVALALSGCAGSPSDLSNSSNQTVIKSDATYQTLYEQIASTAKRCWTGSGIYISAEVDAGFYPNLGYGQVDLIFNDMGSRYFYLHRRLNPAISDPK